MGHCSPVPTRLGVGGVHPHVADGNTKAQTGEVTRLSSQHQHMAELGPTPGTDSKSMLLIPELPQTPQRGAPRAIQGHPGDMRPPSIPCALALLLRGALDGGGEVHEIKGLTIVRSSSLSRAGIPHHPPRHPPSWASLHPRGPWRTLQVSWRWGTNTRETVRSQGKPV